ncbi:CocE/NonD family hydrolase [Kordiimonas sp.]|uniref:CocE/NonD family hydrolase n=1 Tax=Kordiimonas sp. TaxID=1970157 RepID=UPI003B5276BF
MYNAISKTVCALLLLLLSAQSHAAASKVTDQSEGPVKIRHIFDLRTPMRDGVELSSDVWLPTGEGPFPVILLRTPYIKAMPIINFPEWASYFVNHGYAFVVQDVRGRGDSDGKFDFFFQEANDGFDTIESIAEQPWSNGKTCMMGVSYWGTVQWLAAKERPPHLTCLAPTSPAGQYLNELPLQGGAFMMAWALNWFNDTSGKISQGPNSMMLDWESIYSHRPLLTMDEALGRRMPLYRQMLLNDTMDDYWQRIQLTEHDFRQIDLPVLNITGWFDGDQTGTLYYWQGMQEHSDAANNQHLVIGPWTHIQSFMGGSTSVGEVAFADNAIVDIKKLHLDFFDRYLKGSSSEFNQPTVQLYVTGLNKWKSFDAYPLEEAEPTRLYFASGGSANSASGDGALSWEKSSSQANDAYKYDPKNPVALDLSGGMYGVDRQETQKREDILVYTSPVLDEPLDVVGPILVDLYASSDARDTDFTATLSVVYPDGRAAVLGPKATGIIRARYRHGYEETKLLEPGKVERYTIELGHIAHRFRAGERIRIDISSSAAPMFNPNQNTGNPIATDTEWQVARQTVYHDDTRPSALILPVVPSFESGN